MMDVMQVMSQIMMDVMQVMSPKNPVALKSMTIFLSIQKTSFSKNVILETTSFPGISQISH